MVPFWVHLNRPWFISFEGLKAKALVSFAKVAKTGKIRFPSLIPPANFKKS